MCPFVGRSVRRLVMLLSAGRDEPANDLFRVYELVFYYIQQWLEIGFKMCLIHLYEPVCLSVRPAFHIAQQSYQILGLIYHQQSKMHCP